MAWELYQYFLLQNRWTFARTLKWSIYLKVLGKSQPILFDWFRNQNFVWKSLLFNLRMFSQLYPVHCESKPILLSMLLILIFVGKNPDRQTLFTLDAIPKVQVGWPLSLNETYNFRNLRSQYIFSQKSNLCIPSGCDVLSKCLSPTAIWDVNTEIYKHAFPTITTILSLQLIQFRS